MIRKNSIIADRGGHITCIGEDILETVLRHDLKEPLGYGRGRLEETDVFVVIVPESRPEIRAEVRPESRPEIRAEVRPEGSTPGSNNIEDMDWLGRFLSAEDMAEMKERGYGCLILGAFGARAAGPLVRIIKAGDGTGQEASEQTRADQMLSGQTPPKQTQEAKLLDTVFLGHRIKVLMKAPMAAETGENGNTARFTVQVDSQQVVSGEDDADDVFVVASGGKGIKYFRMGSSQSWGISAQEVLAGRTYPPFWDERKMVDEGICLAQVLKPEVVKLLKACNQKSGMQSGDVDGRKVIVKPLFEERERMPFKGWSVLAEEDVAEILTEYSDAYGEIAGCGAPEGLTAEYTFGLRGDDDKIRRIRYLLQKSAPTNTTILLTGESGTGKTFLARKIHSHSKRAGGAFIHVNCAAIPYNLIESELFGYEEGAFTGAKKGGKAGYFEMADGGTLFLDEITEMPLPLQGKLLEVLQSKTYFRIGGEKKKNADVRLIAATNKDLGALVREHRFREDLFYRINVFPVELPPLRKRLDSLFSIVTDLLPGICGRLDVDQQVLSMAALEKMKDYQWPGNIRELENVLEKACILSDGRVIQPEDVELEFAGEAAGGLPEKVRTLKELRESFEKQAIEEALVRNRGSRVKTAKELAIGKTSLFEKMKKYGIDGGKEEADDDEFDSR